MSALRQRPALNRDNAFFFDALEEGRLVAQQCDSCRRFRHPPVPMCPKCHSLDWSPGELSRSGELLMFTVVHHPVVPPFKPGYIVGIVAFEQGVSLVVNVEVAEDDVEIGMSLDVRPHRYDDGLVLPAAFQPGADSTVISSSEGVDH